MSFEKVEIRKFEEKESEFWNPNKGDELQGTVVAVKEGSYGKLFLVIEDDEGNTFITTQCGSLHKLIESSDLDVGDYVKVVYNGRKNDEYRTHDYGLFVWVDDE